MARIVRIPKRDDPSLIEGLVDSGSIGKGFKDLRTENTGSLGLKTSAVKISSSLNSVLDEDDIESPLQLSIQYLTAKVFETRDNTSLSFYSGSEAFVLANANKSSITTLNTASGSLSTRVTTNEAASGSFSTRVTANDAKTGISSAQTTLLSNLGNGVTLSGTAALTISKDRSNNSVITDGTHTWQISAR